MFKRRRVVYSENRTLWYLVLTSLDWPEQLVSARTCQLFNQILNDTHVRANISEKIYNCFIRNTHGHIPKTIGGMVHWTRKFEWRHIHAHIYDVPSYENKSEYPNFVIAVGRDESKNPRLGCGRNLTSHREVCASSDCTFWKNSTFNRSLHLREHYMDNYHDYRYRTTVFRDLNIHRSPGGLILHFLPVKHCALTQLLTIVNKYMDKDEHNFCSCYKRYIDMCRK